MTTIISLAEQIQKQLNALDKTRAMPDSVRHALTAEVSGMVSLIESQANAMLGATQAVRQLKGSFTSIESFFSDLQKWRDHFFALEPEALALGQRGLTLPMWMTARGFQQVLSLGPL